MFELFVSPGKRDVPDCIITWPGLVDMAETKAPGKKPRDGQIRDHARRQRYGMTVQVIDTIGKVDDYIARRRTFWICYSA